MPDNSIKVCLFLLLALIWSGEVAAELYKYMNEDGITVLDSHVPARYVKNGYTILSLDGRVLEVVPRALSEEEIRIRDRGLAEQRAREEQERERHLADQSLLRLYSRPEDVVRARDTKLASIEGFIETSRGNISRLEEQRRSIESALADVERAGGNIDKGSLDRIAVIASRVAQIELEIESKQAELKELQLSYENDLKRVKELYGTSARDDSAANDGD